MPRLLIAAMVGGALAGSLASCDTGFPAGREPHHEFNFLDMADQPKLKPQRAAPRRLQPPVGAVAVDYYPYPYTAAQGARAGRQVQNPLQGTEAERAHGKFVFDNVCIVCHGAQAAGDGEVAKLFPAPPSLMTQRVRDWPDGRIFHVPMRGQNSMPSYAKQLEQRDMWAAVLHIRALQGELPVAPPAPGQTPDGAGGGGGGGGEAGAGGAAGGGGAGGADGAAGGGGAEQHAGGASAEGVGGTTPAPPSEPAPTALPADAPREAPKEAPQTPPTPTEPPPQPAEEVTP